MSSVAPLLPLATNIIPENQISLGRISGLLTSAYIDHLEDEDDLYVTAHIDFPVWIAVDENYKLPLVLLLLRARSWGEHRLARRGPRRACQGAQELI